MYVGLCQLAVTVLSHKRLWVLHSKQFIVRLKKNSLPVLTGTWRTWYNRYTSKKGSKRGVKVRNMWSLVSLGPVVTPTRWIYSGYTLDIQYSGYAWYILMHLTDKIMAVPISLHREASDRPLAFAHEGTLWGHPPGGKMWTAETADWIELEWSFKVFIMCFSISIGQNYDKFWRNYSYPFVSREFLRWTRASILVAHTVLVASTTPRNLFHLNSPGFVWDSQLSHQKSLFFSEDIAANSGIWISYV